MLIVWAAVMVMAPSALAIPPDCWEVCTSSTPCSQLCYEGGVTTCGATWICDDGGSPDPGICSTSCSTYIYGTSNGDTLFGNSYNNCIDGGAGADTLYGDSGGDRLFGEDGNDTLYGGSGDDCLVGGAGSDHLDGGTGVDTCTEGETYVSC
ncbi:MAG TPA: calcium-binding protein [Thermoanaerobaculia bacterium]|nr:calcium-binding protein [Thermoanaerobaculia bacterium]